MYTTFITLFAFILAILILVAFHEYGHFKIARLCGIKVIRFCVGFGPAWYKTIDKHGTEFVVSPIPLGGYVKMLDEREGEVDPKERHLEFNNKKPWQKIAVVSAGPIFNFILAFVAFYFMFLYGIAVERPVIQYLEPGSIAQKAGMQTNQEIISVDNNQVESFSDLQVALASRLGTSGEIVIKTRPFDYKAQDAKYSDVDIREFKLQVNNLSADINSKPITQSLGIGLLPKDKESLLIDSIKSDTNADLSNLKVGDVITGYDGKKVEKWDDFLNYIKTNPDSNLELNINRQGVSQISYIKIGSKTQESDNKKIGFLGVAFKYPIYFKTQNFGIFKSISKALVRTYEYITRTFYMIYKLIVGELGLETVRGPVMVAKVAGIQLQIGISYFLNFLAIVSIGLGVINLLPIPVLDGGHLVYHLYELLTGKRVSEMVEKISLAFGLLVLALMMSVAFYNDFTYW